MTSKDRVRMTLDHKESDKVPIGEFAIDSPVAERILGRETYFRNWAKCKIAYWEGRRDEVVESLKEDGVELFKKLDILDIINLNSSYFAYVPPKNYKPEETPKKIDKGTWEYKDGRILKYSELTRDINIVYDPHTYTRKIRDNFILDSDKLPQAIPEDPSCFEVIDLMIEKFGKEKFIIGRLPKANEFPLLGGMERGLFEMAMSPEKVERAMLASIVKVRKQLDVWQPRPYDAILSATDFSDTRGPMMSPEMFRRFCLPAMKFNAESAHKKKFKYYFQHACGNNWKILDMFIEAGIDCYQSIQSVVMDIKDLKNKYGQKLTLWGGISIEKIMSGSRDEVRKNVRYALENAKKGGGYICGCSHSVAGGSKYDNYMAALDEFSKYRDY